MKKTICIPVAILLVFAISVSACAEPSPVRVKNGQIIVSPDYEQVCPFSVETKSEHIYYVYLEYQRAPSNTTVDRSLKSNASGQQGDISFIVTENSKVELDVPIGVYKLYYCVGTTWYGTKDKFGEETGYYSSNELLDFYADSQYYRGHSLELWKQSEGNFEDHTISEDSFPDTEETSSETSSQNSMQDRMNAFKEKARQGSSFSSGRTAGSGQTSGKYLTTDELPDNPGDMNQLAADWLAYPAYDSDFHAVEPEITIRKGEKTKLSLFRSEKYNGASYSYVWYGGGDVSLDWAGNGVGWAGHSHVGYITATEVCTIFMSAKDSDGITAHMVIHVK